eukprot:5096705-Amphidinium_carterae.1
MQPISPPAQHLSVLLADCTSTAMRRDQNRNLIFHVCFEPASQQLNPACHRSNGAWTHVATTKTHPTWQPEYSQNRGYAYDIEEYPKDVLRWSAATEVAIERQGH